MTPATMKENMKPSRSPHAGQQAEGLFASLLLRLVADDEAGQVHDALGPEGMQFGADLPMLAISARGRSGTLFTFVDQDADAVTQELNMTVGYQWSTRMPSSVT